MDIVLRIDVLLKQYTAKSGEDMLWQRQQSILHLSLQFKRKTKMQCESTCGVWQS